MVTGTGTIGDPYIVSTWDEFTSKCGETGGHIKWADSENKTLDFNDINPNGYDTYLEIDANVDFNGWTFMNYYCHNGMFRIAPGIIVENGRFLNINANIKSTGVWYGLTGLPPNSSGRYTIRRCIFAGLLTCVDVSNLIMCDANIYYSGISMYVTYYDDINEIISDGYINHSKINLNLRANLSTSTELVSLSMTIDNSTINLKPSFNRMYTRWKIISNGKHNVFNIDCSEIQNFQDLDLGISQSGMSIVNSDLLGNVDVYNTSNITKVTSQQMLDTEYLLSIGFPTGVDTDVV